MTDNENVKEIENEITAIVRNNIGAAFQARGISIKEVSDITKISRSTINGLIHKENNCYPKRDIQLTTLIRLAKGLHFPIDLFYKKNTNFDDYVYVEKNLGTRNLAIDNEIIKLSADKFETPIDCMVAILSFSSFLSPQQQNAIKSIIETFVN